MKNKKSMIGKAIFLSVKQLRKRASIFFISLFFGLFFFSGFFVAAAANRIPEPNAEEKTLLGLFWKFDHMYSERQTKKRVYMEEWIKLGKELSEKRIALSLYVSPNFLLRAALIEGESYLLASQDYFRNKDPEYINLYEKGITILEQVIIDADRFPEIYKITKAEIDYLPSYSHDMTVKKQQGKYRVQLNPFAGRETIGTGFEEHATIRGRKVTYDIKPYATILEFLDDIKKDLVSRGRIRQISTTETARTLLSHFCPWGVKVYFLLERARFTSNVDFSILRPYAGGLDKSLHTRLIANLESLFSSRRPYLPVWEVSPMVSDLSISSNSVPEGVRTEMNRIVGKEDENSKKGIHEGTVGKLINRQIRWLWVGEPTYNIWYVSPTIYNWKASDYINLIFNLYKWASGGLVGRSISIAVDSVASKITNEFFNFFKTSPFPIPFFSNILTEGVKDQYSGLISGEKISATGTLKAQKWLDLKDLFMDITSYAIDSIEKNQRDTIFGGLDPERLSMGKTYDGTQIPSVLLVSNVTGVQEVPDEEYPKLINVVRFYLVAPRIGETQVKYDMTNAPLISHPLEDWNITWSKIKSPLKSYEIVTSLAPGAQFLKFELDPETTKHISGSDRVAIEIWTTTLMEDRKKYATAYIKPGDKSFMISLFNQDIPASKKDYNYSLTFPDGGMVFNDRDIPPTTNMLKDHKARKGEYHTALVPLKAQYELRLKINGTYVKPVKDEDRYLINLYSGPRGGGRDPNTGQTMRKKQPITGKLSVNPSKPTYQQLDYDRKIKILVAKTKKSRVNPDKARE